MFNCSQHTLKNRTKNYILFKNRKMMQSICCTWKWWRSIKNKWTTCNNVLTVVLINCSWNAFVLSTLGWLQHCECGYNYALLHTHLHIHKHSYTLAYKILHMYVLMQVYLQLSHLQHFAAKEELKEEISTRSIVKYPYSTPNPIVLKPH